MRKTVKPIIALVVLIGSVFSPVSPAVGSDSNPSVSVMYDTLNGYYNGASRIGDSLRNIDSLSVYPEGGVAEDYRDGGKNAGKSWSYRLLISDRYCEGGTITSDQVPYTVSLNFSPITGCSRGQATIVVDGSPIELGVIQGPIYYNKLDRSGEYLVGKTMSNLCYKPADTNIVHYLGGEVVTTCTYTFTNSDIGKTWVSVSLNIRTGEFNSSTGDPVLSSLLSFKTVPSVQLTGSGLPNTVLSCRFSGSFSPNPTTRQSGIMLDGDFARATRNPGTYTYTYVVRPSDVGKLASCSDEARRPGYTVTEVTSPTTVRILGYGVTPPSISGIPNPGRTLECRVDGWGSSTSITYQWLRDGLPIAGETSTNYGVRISDVGKVITVRINGTLVGAPSAASTSAGITILASTTGTPTPTPSASPKATPTPTPSASPKATPTPTPSASPKATPTPSASPEATPTPSPTSATPETNLSAVLTSPKKARQNDLKSLSPIEVSKIPSQVLAKIPSSTISAISPIQAGQLSASQVNSLPTSSLQKIRPKAIQSLESSTLSGLTVAQLSKLTDTQKSALLPSQVRSLSPEQKRAVGRR